MALSMPCIGGNISLMSCISPSQVSFHTGHCHKCSQSSFSCWHALHAVSCPPFPFRYRALCNMFLNQEEVSRLVPRPLAMLCPMAVHGISMFSLLSQLLLQLGGGLLSAVRALYISFTPIWSRGLLSGTFSNVQRYTVSTTILLET